MASLYQISIQTCKKSSKLCFYFQFDLPIILYSKIIYIGYFRIKERYQIFPINLYFRIQMTL